MNVGQKPFKENEKMETETAVDELEVKTLPPGNDPAEALLEALDHGKDWWRHVNVAFDEDRQKEWWAGLSQADRAHWLLGRLWNCTDILGSMYHGEITDRDPWQEHKHVLTVAALVRLLAKELKVRAAA
jgi:hypothetical protein